MFWLVYEVEGAKVLRIVRYNKSLGSSALLLHVPRTLTLDRRLTKGTMTGMF